MSEEEIMASLIAASPDDYQIGKPNLNPLKKSTWIMAADGTYNIINNNVFTASFLMSEHQIPGLPKGDEWELFQFQFKLPKIPYKMFERLIAFYRHIHNKYKSEVFVAIYFDVTEQEWKFEIPKQKVSGGLVEWDTKVTSKFDDKNKIFALETHSHHTMFGHFSSTDDADQQLPERIHLVIGHIMDDEVEFTLRVKNKESIIELDLDMVFDGKPDLVFDDTFDDFPEWNDNVKKKDSKAFNVNTEFDKFGATSSNYVEDNYSYPWSEDFDTAVNSGNKGINYDSWLQL